ncbi:DUF1559 family PulG-like putative transporter [Aquisphaera insulae]|uniref:DUF1559 family PulG-like putative transporter n=1 Tax=Aquisphaera insulae TaxID=2712864 RepID=UPI0013EBD94B|nr:DUF1559 domain-containing protein [Aquisphaera insulae]
MSFPRVRFTIRRMMLLVAGAALAAGSVLLLQRSSEAAHDETCRQNLRGLSLAFANYASAEGSFPTGTIANDQLPPERRLSWLVSIWAFLDQWTWMLNRALSWDSTENRVTRGHGIEEGPVAVGRLPALACPAAAGGSREHMPGWTWYVGIGGLGLDAPELPVGHPRAGILGYDRRARPADVTDGLANTLLVVETDRNNGPWTAGGPPTLRGLDPGDQPYLGRDHQFGGLHRGVANALFADGSVRPVRETIDPKVFEALSTAAGGESLPASWER